MNISTQNHSLTGWLFFIAACCGCVGFLSIIRADDVDLMIGTDPPFRLRVSLRSDEAKWTDHFQKVQDQYHNLLFDRLDANQDGQLNEPEAQRTPAPVFRLEGSQIGNSNETHIAFNFLVLDDDGDGLISREELKAYYDNYDAGPIALEPMNRAGLRAGRTTPLFQRLDANQDAYLDAQEIQAATKLQQWDRNADELLSLAELKPSVAVSDSGQFIATSPPYVLSAVENYPIHYKLVQGDTPKVNGHLHVPRCCCGNR